MGWVRRQDTPHNSPPAGELWGVIHSFGVKRRGSDCELISRRRLRWHEILKIFVVGFEIAPSENDGSTKASSLRVLAEDNGRFVGPQAHRVGLDFVSQRLK